MSDKKFCFLLFPPIFAPLFSVDTTVHMQYRSNPENTRSRVCSVCQIFALGDNVISL